MSFDKISEELDGEFEAEEQSMDLAIVDEEEDLEPDENDSDATFVKKGFKRNLQTAEKVTNQIANNIEHGDYDNRTIEVFSNMMMTVMNGYNHLAKMDQADKNIALKKKQMENSSKPAELPPGGEGLAQVPMTPAEFRKAMKELEGQGIDVIDAEFSVLDDSDAEKHPSEIEASEDK